MKPNTSAMIYQTKLAKRGNTYYFRAKVPLDLIAHFGKKEIKLSLKTTDKREASRLCNLKAVEWDEQLEELRGKRSTPVVNQALQKITQFDEELITKISNFLGKSSLGSGCRAAD